MDRDKLKALISLLDDPDSEILNVVSDSLMKQGLNAIPELEKAWENTIDESLQNRLGDVIQGIQLNHARNNLANWQKTGAEHILEGAFYVAQYQFPDINMADMEREIENIRKDVWLEINDNLTALEKVRILNYIIFDIYKYSKNITDIYSPQNSYINQVINTKKGNPVSLSVIYLSVANRLELPIYGVSLPKNFILAYKDDYKPYNSDNGGDEILFYINPFDNGAVLGKREIEYYISNQKLEQDETYYTPCSNVEIIIQLINNLVLSYDRLSLHDKAEKYKELLQTLN
ncbi:MAG: transglutaminase family protein [Bacteroidales bacterium]|nr:MAG: transglutaminase family protein [Bacteroidales bacterium]